MRKVHIKSSQDYVEVATVDGKTFLSAEYMESII